MATIMTHAVMQAKNLTLDEMQEQEIHLTGNDCWCKPDVEQVEGK